MVVAQNRVVEYRPPAPAVDAGAAEWIAPRLLADFGAVCRTIPTGFDAYARVFHPADPGTGTSTRWAEIAAQTGRTMHARAQFHRIATPCPLQDALRFGPWPTADWFLARSPNLFWPDDPLDSLAFDGDNINTP